jgi:hypothetical protein
MQATASTSALASRRVIVGVILIAMVALVGGIAIAANDGDEAPVVTIDSSVEEQIAALDFQLAEFATQLDAATSEAEATAIQSQIDTIEGHVSKLCAQLTPNSAPEACAAVG